MASEYDLPTEANQPQNRRTDRFALQVALAGCVFIWLLALMNVIEMLRSR